MHNGDFFMRNKTQVKIIVTDERGTGFLPDMGKLDAIRNYDELERVATYLVVDSKASEPVVLGSHQVQEV